MTQSRNKAPLSLTRTWASAADSVAVDEQTETSQAPAEATSAADLPEPSAADSQAPEAAQEPKIADPVIQEFTDLFAALSAELHERGYYQDRPEYTVPNKSRSELGIEKRALLTMARERIDILYSLPVDKLKAIASNDLPYVDRKTKNALERLAGTFVEGHSVDQSFGGEATTQDLVRLVLCAHIACDRDVKRSNDIVSEADSQALMPSFLTAISAVLPDIVSVLKAEPDATALERADAAEAAKVARHESSIQRGEVSSERRGRDDRNQDMRPGDWMCPSCNVVNFANRTECFRCSEARPESAGPVRGRGSFGGDRFASNDSNSKPGDWPCPACGANNFARRTECFRCDEPRPGHLPGPSGFSNNRGAPPAREGDWACPECGVNNFAYRGECFRCQTSRPGGPPPPRRQSRGYGAPQGDFGERQYSERPAPEMRPGDWMCPDCGAHNFASKIVCYRCSHDRPESAGPPVERRNRGSYGDSRGRGSSEGWTSGGENRSSGGYGGGSSRNEPPADLEW
ncbi:g1294 [Coccomyxa viridis]|uniref:G1294 protein n=1 Tax=Coccomyxa viridis TaxID=1274662 RepID=A0ABP1FHN7_9CHLO